MVSWYVVMVLSYCIYFCVLALFAQLSLMKPIELLSNFSVAQELLNLALGKNSQKIGFGNLAQF